MSLVQKPLLMIACALLDNQQTQTIMSNGFWTKLMLQCGRMTREQLAKRARRPGARQSSAYWPTWPALGIDVPVSDPTGDPGLSTTQSETSTAINGDIVCSGYNDDGGFPPSLSGFS